MQEVRAVAAVSFFRERGIDPILIKGIAAAEWYPDEIARPSVDVDLAVSAVDFPRAKGLLETEGSHLAVDIHRELRHLDTLAWDDLYANSVEMQLSTGTIRVLRPEDHLRVLCVHWLTDGGAYRDRLFDVVYAVQRRPIGFDWNRFLGSVSPKRQRWLRCCLGVAAKYFDLDLTGTPAEGADNDLPAWFTRSIEKSWSSDLKHIPLEATIFNRGEFSRQLISRLRPNPIYSTIQIEGSFDAPTRLHYQVLGFFMRIAPSIRRVSGVLARTRAGK